MTDEKGAAAAVAVAAGQAVHFRTADRFELLSGPAGLGHRHGLAPELYSSFRTGGQR